MAENSYSGANAKIVFPIDLEMFFLGGAAAVEMLIGIEMSDRAAG